MNGTSCYSINGGWLMLDRSLKRLINSSHLTQQDLKRLIVVACWIGWLPPLKLVLNLALKVQKCKTLDQNFSGIKEIS